MRLERMPGVTILMVLLVAGGCARDEAGTKGAQGSPKAASGSKLDHGPRAAEAPVSEELVEQGETLFKDKGCSACHMFGKRLTGPDLAGVTQRRTAQWIENQILHPDKMTKEDPIARKLFAEFALQMPNQGLTEAQARSVIEYFKSKDRGGADPD